MPSRIPDQDARALRVVVIDDHDDTREMTSELLLSYGFDVRAHGTVAAALATIRDDPPDAVLTDVIVGAESGLDLAVALRAEPSFDRVALIAVTGVERTELGSATGLDAIWGKPIDVDSFADRIRTIVGRRRG